jgi:hypothetical protein
MPASVEGANGKALLAAAQDRKQGGEGDPTDELPCREAATWSIGSRRSRAQPQPLRLPSAGPLSVLLGRVGSTGPRAGYPRAGYRRMASTSRSSSLFMQVPIVGGGIVDGHGPPSRRPHTNGEAPGSRPRPRRGMCTAAARRGARASSNPRGEGDGHERAEVDRRRLPGPRPATVAEVTPPRAGHGGHDTHAISALSRSSTAAGPRRSGRDRQRLVGDPQHRR